MKDTTMHKGIDIPIDDRPAERKRLWFGTIQQLTHPQLPIEVAIEAATKVVAAYDAAFPPPPVLTVTGDDPRPAEWAE